MISDENNSNADRQQFIDLLCQLSAPDEKSNVVESNIELDSEELIEEGEIVALDDENRPEIEDGELTASSDSEVKQF